MPTLRVLVLLGFAAVPFVLVPIAHATKKAPRSDHMLEIELVTAEGQTQLVDKRFVVPMDGEVEDLGCEINVHPHGNGRHRLDIDCRSFEMSTTQAFSGTQQVLVAEVSDSQGTVTKVLVTPR